MKIRLWLCLIPLLPMACGAHRARRHLLAPDQRARLQRVVPRVSIKRVYRVADGQAEPGIYKLTFESQADSQATKWSWAKSLAPFVGKPNGPTFHTGPDAQTHQSIAMLTTLLKSTARPLPAAFQDDGEVGTLVEGADVPEGLFEPVLAPDARGVMQLSGWRPVRTENSQTQTEKSQIQTCTSLNTDRLYELAFERSIIIFRPVAVQEALQKNHPAPNEKSVIAPVKYEQELPKEEAPSSHSGGPTSTDKLLSQLQAEWAQYLPPPWPARLFAPVLVGPDRSPAVSIYYEGPPMQWQDGQWVAPEETKKR